MEEFVDATLELYNAGRGVLPFVLIAFLIGAFVYFRKDIQAWFHSKIKAQEAIAKNEGERNEIIRNNSATIEACSAVLEMVSKDREKFLISLDKHEELSKERIERIQAAVDQCRNDISDIHGDVGILLDRNK